MPVRVQGAPGVYTEIAAAASTTNNQIVLPANNGSAYQLRRNGATAGTTEFVDNIVSGTAVASTSGTFIDFTGIPAWVKRITVMFNGVSTNGTSPYLIRLGTTGGIETTGYLTSAFFGSSVNQFLTDISGFVLITAGNISAANAAHGSLVFSQVSGNTWVAQGVFHQTATGVGNSAAGSKTLSGTLDRVRITTVNGTDTFDAGTINILYE